MLILFPALLQRYGYMYWILYWIVWTAYRFVNERIPKMFVAVVGNNLCAPQNWEPPHKKKTYRKIRERTYSSIATSPSSVDWNIYTHIHAHNINNINRWKYTAHYTWSVWTEVSNSPHIMITIRALKYIYIYMHLCFSFLGFSCRNFFFTQGFHLPLIYSLAVFLSLFRFLNCTIQTFVRLAYVLWCTFSTYARHILAIGHIDICMSLIIHVY